MEHASKRQQTKIYTQTCFRVFRNEKGWKVFISAGIIMLIICLVTGEDMFKADDDTRSGAFAIICACIWIGIFNSIQSICRERDIIKREYRAGLNLSAYMNAHFVFEMTLCAIESVIVTVIIYVANIMNVPGKGVMLPTALELLITFFLVIFSSDVLGLMISSIVKTTGVAMTVMPFILILQLVMSGILFELKGITEMISYITVSKWGMEAFCTTSNLNGMTFLSSDDAYTFSPGNLMTKWFVLIVFIIVYRLVAVAFLKLVDRDKR